MRYNLENGHSILVEQISNDNFKITFFEDERKLFDELGNADYIEFEYGIEI